MSVGYDELRKANELLQNAKALQEQKLYFGKGSTDDIDKLAMGLRNEAYDLLQGKITAAATEGVTTVTVPTGQFVVDIGDLTQEQAAAFVAEVRKKFAKKPAEEEDPLKRVAGAPPLPTGSTPSMPKVTPSEAKAPEVADPKVEAKLVDIVPKGDIVPIPPEPPPPANQTQGMKAPKVQIPEDTTRRRAKG